MYMMQSVKSEQNLKGCKAEERETGGVWKTVAGGGFACSRRSMYSRIMGNSNTNCCSRRGYCWNRNDYFLESQILQEGAQDIYYGSIGDIDSTVNDLKYVVFQGNEGSILSDRKCLCIFSIRNDSNRSGSLSRKPDISKWSKQSLQRRNYNSSRCRSPEVYDGFNWKPDRRNVSRYGSKYMQLRKD